MGSDHNSLQQKKTDLLANPLVFSCWLLNHKTLYFCFSVFRLSKLVSIMGEWVGLGVFPGTNYYCWICGSAKNSTTKNWYWLYIGMPIICVHHVFDAWWNSLLRQIQKVWLENMCIYTYSYNWFSITSFAEQVGANHGGEGGPWPGASSSLPCLPCQQVTYSRIFTCQ